MVKKFAAVLNTTSHYYPSDWWLVMCQSSNIDVVGFVNKSIADRVCQLLNDSTVGDIYFYEKLTDRDNILISMALEQVRLENNMTWKDFLPLNEEKLFFLINKWIARANELKIPV